MVIIALSITIVALIGYIFKLKFSEKPQEEKKPKKMTKEEKEKQKEIKKAFDNLMRYDIEVAVRRK